MLYGGIEMKLAARALALIMILSVLPLNAFVIAEGTTVYVAVNNQKFYKKPSESASVAGILGYGSSVVCTNIENDWAFVKSGGETAYCPISGLMSTDPNAYSKAAYVKSTDAKFYRRPADSANAKAIAINTAVTVIAITPDEKWCRVESGDKTGYIKAAHLAASKSETSAKAYVTDNFIKVYKSASRSASVIAYSGYGMKLNCVEIDGEWIKVKNGSKYGWIRADGISKKNPNTLSESASVDSKTKLREYPSTSAGSQCTISAGADIKIIAQTKDGKWLRVKYGKVRGYLPAEDVSRGASKKVNSVLRLASQQVGKPYAYATRGPDSFDCAGLTIYCFAKYSDIELGRSAELQGYNEKLAMIKSADELRKGDIVCFNTDETDDDLTDHVGIYLGNGKFVHASSAKGKVIVSSMDSGYYKRVFSWGRRVID